MNIIDLFAGASGMSEGFIRSGFNPVAHIEMDVNACYTIKTRTAYHYLKNKGELTNYFDYLAGKISREEMYKKIPSELLNIVVNKEINSSTIKGIFKYIDQLRDNKKIDIIIGGPPCQAYSLVGISRDPKRMKGDKRKFLFRYYAEFLKHFEPKYFVFENVGGLLSVTNKRYFDEMLKLFKEIGYSVDFRMLHAEDFGVLQKRSRVVLIGRKGKSKFDFPEIEKTPNDGQLKRDIFLDLPELNPGQQLLRTKYINKPSDYLKKNNLVTTREFVTQHITRDHNQRDLEIFSIAIDKWLNKSERLKYNDLPNRLQSHKNTKGFLDRYKVVDPNGLSHTLVAHIAKDGNHYIYPNQTNPRSLSVREAARIQSFPDDFFFEGGRTAAFKQIGNAVPPNMAYYIANTINKLL